MFVEFIICVVHFPWVEDVPLGSIASQNNTWGRAGIPRWLGGNHRVGEQSELPRAYEITFMPVAGGRARRENVSWKRKAWFDAGFGAS